MEDVGREGRKLDMFIPHAFSLPNRDGGMPKQSCLVVNGWMEASDSDGGGGGGGKGGGG